MSSATRRVGIAGAVVGAAAAAVGAGLATEHLVARRARRAPDPEAREQFGALHTRGRTVYADDGVPLHVEEDGKLDATLTVVFVHGFTLSMDCWHYQRRDLSDLARLVFYDQRSHGASGRGPRGHATVDWLGRDLAAVLRATCPRGPVVLVGHSMGGMSIMALADRDPALFRDRIAGVVLISTSSGQVLDRVFSLPGAAGWALRTSAPQLITQLGRGSGWLERGRPAGGDLSFLLTRRFAFGRPVPPSVVAFMERMIGATPIEVMAEFLPIFVDHDKLAALAHLATVPTLVVTGDRDLLIPSSHSSVIAGAVPGAELVTLADAGHMVILERPALVNLNLRAFIHRAGRGRRRAATA